MQPPLPTPDELLRTALGTEPTIPPAPADLAAHLPELEILAPIGQGGMGAVYRVRRRADGKLLALKVVRPEAGKEAAFTARFAREAEALERLRHPNIVAIHGHGAAGPWCWLLMDLVEGANLREIVATGRLSPAQTLALVPPLCAALQYAHDQGVVHRDLKPENILLDAAGVPHLVDFGLAKLRDGAAGSDLTNTGAGMGTVHYMAPEQVASAKDVDHRADIYALGVVIYELLTGELPLGRFENPSQRAAVDARIDAVVLKALERDRERRWQEMRQVGQAVAMAAGKGGAAVATSAAIPAKSWQPWQVIVALCLPLIVILLLPLNFHGKAVLAAGALGLLFVGWLAHLVRQRRWRTLKLVLGAALVVTLAVLVIGAGLWFWQNAAHKRLRSAELARLEAERKAEQNVPVADWLSFEPGLPAAEIDAFLARLRAVETSCAVTVRAPVMSLLEQVCALADIRCEATADLGGHEIEAFDTKRLPVEDLLRHISRLARIRLHWTGRVLQVLPILRM